MPALTGFIQIAHKTTSARHFSHDRRASCLLVWLAWFRLARPGCTGLKSSCLPIQHRMQTDASINCSFPNTDWQHIHNSTVGYASSSALSALWNIGTPPPPNATWELRFDSPLTHLLVITAEMFVACVETLAVRFVRIMIRSWKTTRIVEN